MSIFLRALIAREVSCIDDPILKPDLFKLEIHLSSGINYREEGLIDIQFGVDGDQFFKIACSHVLC
jgi:hypothetical protein